MKKKLLLFVISWMVMASGAANAAVYYVLVPDMSQLSWQMDPNGVVWFRNLNSFDSTVLGCCYNFSIDTTTPAGKSMWSAVLAKIETDQPLWLVLANGNTSPGPISYIGNW
jgi:hypothetical protein